MSAQALSLPSVFSFGKKNGTEALSQRKSTAEQLPFAQLCARLCRLAQRLRLRASTDTMSSRGGADGASARPKRARAGQRAQRMDEDGGATATVGAREGTQPKKSRSRDGGLGAALVCTDYVARSEPLWPSLCVCVARCAAGVSCKLMLCACSAAGCHLLRRRAWFCRAL